tara:strand:+ start:1069 stop:1263 length:195 start_codon:yes stop_codon:yes gene_type:complete
MTTILISILLFGLFVFALSLRMILFNEPEVRGTCASQNPLLKSEEESCSYCGKKVKPGQECIKA